MNRELNWKAEYPTEPDYCVELSGNLTAHVRQIHGEDLWQEIWRWELRDADKIYPLAEETDLHSSLDAKRAAEKWLKENGYLPGSTQD